MTSRRLSMLVALGMAVPIVGSLGAAPAPASPAHARATVRVELTAPAQVSNQAPTRVRVVLHRARTSGTVVVRDDRRVVARTAVRPAAGPTRVTIELPPLRSGRHELQAAFRTSAGVLGRSQQVAVSSRPGCAWRPRACGFPDSATTGVRRGVNLRSVPDQVRSGKGWHYDERGWIAVDTDGAVLQGVDTNGLSVDVTASDVVIRNNRIEVTGDGWGVALRTGDNITIRRNDIFSPTQEGPQRLLVGIKDIYGTVSDVVVERNDIWHASTGIQMDSGTIRHNFVHASGFTSGDHTNGIMSTGGSDPLVIDHNTVFVPYEQTDAIGLFQDFGRQSNRRITRNLVAGGGYTIYAGANPGKESGATDIVVADNRFASIYFERSGYWGPATAYEQNAGNVWSGNVWDTNGTPVPRP